MRRFFLENTILKAVSLLIAILLWAYIGTSQMLERRESIQLEFTAIPAGLDLGPGAKAQASVVFRGRREAIRELDPETLKAVVTFRPDSKPDVVMILVPRVRNLPKGVIADVPAQTLKLVPAPSAGR
jgi:hypothetical protein